MSNDIILDTKLVAEIKGDFYVPSYQRGYRWSEAEVIRLLDDVYQNGKKNYCLQPVVVRKKGDAYELIDGQQRLTTIYLIYKYMKDVNPFFNESAFTLSYQTREQSAEFLKSLDVSKQDDNIDYWFIANAYKTIQKWFEQDMQIRVMHIFEYFKEDVKIIWYEVNESEDAVSLFTRLNIGKAGFDKTKDILARLLQTNEVFSNDILDAIITTFTAQCENDSVYPWTYYYVKYPIFRPGKYGKLSNNDAENKPYLYLVMQTRYQWSYNTYIPYLKEADDAHLSREDCGRYLAYGDSYIACKNDSYVVYKMEENRRDPDVDTPADTIPISQNEEGLDTEDRIVKLKEYITNMN